MSITEELIARQLDVRRQDGSLWPANATPAQYQAEIDHYDSLPQCRQRARRKLAAQARDRHAGKAELLPQAVMALLPLLVTVIEGGTLTAGQNARLAKIKPLLMAAGADAMAEINAARKIATSATPETETPDWPVEPD